MTSYGVWVCRSFLAKCFLENIFDLKRAERHLVSQLFRCISVLGENQVNGQDEGHFERLQGGLQWLVRRVKFETILKDHKWYLCQISRTNHAIICLYYYPTKGL